MNHVRFKNCLETEKIDKIGELTWYTISHAAHNKKVYFQEKLYQTQKWFSIAINVCFITEIIITLQLQRKLYNNILFVDKIIIICILKKLKDLNSCFKIISFGEGLVNKSSNQSNWGSKQQLLPYREYLKTFLLWIL